LTVLVRDECPIAVDKPCGLAVHRGRARERDVAMVRARDPIGARVVHNRYASSVSWSRRRAACVREPR
jgi:23S rRNA-/tRNA-specific pseudouridylate synthase